VKRTLLTFAAVSLSCLQPVSAQVIQTIAGGGPPDGTTATLANFNIPRGTVMDSAGNFYVSLQSGHKVLKITAGGQIYTYAGSGGRGFSGDGGLAVSASLDSPFSLALDAAGNLYIGDNGNARVRRVNAVTGIISTIAGTGLTGFTGDGVATSSRISGASGMAIVGDNLYIADGGNNRIRLVVLSTGIISTLAGTGTACSTATNPCGDGGPATAAQLNFPADVVVDGAGNLLLSDRNLRKIRRVDAVSGVITTVAGDGNFCNGIGLVCGDGGLATAAQLSTPYDIVLDPAGNLYIIDDFLRRVRKLDFSTGLLTKVAGSSNCSLGTCGDGGPALTAGMNVPTHGLFNSTGDFLVVDAGLNRIRRIDSATGIISNFAGNGSATFYGDGGPATDASLGLTGGTALDSAGNLYFTDNVRVRRMDALTGVVTTYAGSGITCASVGTCGDGGLATNAQLRGVIGLAFDSTGNLFIVDVSNFRIRRVDAVTKIITTIAGNNSQCTNGTFLCGDGGSAVSAFMGQPIGIAFDSAGNLLVADALLRKIRRIVPGADGKITGAADEIITTVIGNGVLGYSGDNGPALSAQVSGIRFIAFDPAGSLHIADLNNSVIRRVSPGADNIITGAADEIITTVAGSVAGFLGDGGLATSARLNSPRGVAFDSPGNLYISDAGNQRIRRVNAVGGAINSTSTIETIVGTGTLGFSGDGGPAVLARIATPENMVVDALGRLLIAEIGNNRIRAVANSANRVPLANAGPDQTMLVASSTTWPVTLDASATSDPDGDAMTFTWTGSFGSASGSNPTVNLPLGTSAITLTVKDGRGGIATDVVVVTLTNTTTAINVTPSNQQYGQNVSYNIVVSSPLGGTPTGAVTVTWQGFSSQNYNLVNGQVNFGTTAFTAIGSSTFSAQYLGDSTYKGSSASTVLTVTKSSTTVSLTSSVNPSQTGQAVTFNATVNVTPPGGQTCCGPLGTTGTLQFQVDGVDTGSPTTIYCCYPFNLVNMAGSLSLSTLPAGPHVITAVYSGDTKYNGSTGTVTQTVISPDSTPPVITPTVTGTLGNNGWYTSNVNVSWSVTDGQSAVTSTTGCGASSVTADTAGVTFTCSATSGGGSASQSVTVKRDATPPSASASRLPAANPSGWNNTDVVVTFSGADALSGIAGCSGAVTLSAEGSGQSATGTCTDNAGNVSTGATQAGINIDKTPPSSVANQTPAANAFGWNNTDVNVTFSGTDGLSGIATCSSPVTLNAEGSNQSSSGSCTDKAGNVSASATASGINIDKTPPTAAAAASPAANVNGWNNSNVVVSFSGTDALSGIDTCSAASALTAEGAGQASSGTCTDKAGNTSASATASGINIDKTAPGVSCAAADGLWHASDASIACTANDPLSGLAASGDALFSLVTSVAAGSETANAATDSRNVCDAAGNCSTAGPIGGNQVDKKAPAISSSRAPAANSFGWNNSNVTATFACSDGGSGLAAGSPPAPTIFSTEGTGQSASGACTDAVGNSASATVSSVNIDKTPPTVAGTPSRSADSNGWYNHALNVTWSGSDGLSGLDACSAASAYAAPDSANASVSGTCTDRAGNLGNGSATFQYDSTPPMISLSSPASGGVYVLNSAVAANYACTDATSGAATCAGTIANGANINTGAVGSQTFSVSATDGAGNSATSNRSYSVAYAASGTCLGSAGHQILQPVNTDGTSVFKQKSTVPAKFRVCDANGNSIGSGNVVSSFFLIQTISGTVVSAVNEPVDSTTPDTTFRWSASDQQWIFNINTKSLAANVTYVYRIVLNDGSVIDFRFGLK